MTTPEQVDLSLNLDSSGYVQGAQEASAASAQLSRSWGEVQHNGSLVSKVMAAVTPTRALTAGFAGATAAAASWQSQLSQISARSAVTGQSVDKLSRGIQGLARTFPVGNSGAREVVQTIQEIGVTSAKQIKTVDNLGASFIRLGAATGQNASMIGRQLLMLDRSFGGQDSNVDRFNKMSDSLTTVQAKIGGNASEILSFSKNIAPFARQAGIGQTAVMGISAAFSKMGEDGYAASNSMNKVLSDLTRSVRDGSGEMGTYANIVGKTRNEFEQLFKLNPTQAVQEVIGALAAPGAQGQRNAERIGLDGTRTQRVFQAVGQQGGIAAAAATAVSAYGDGSTAKAAKASEGLSDEFTKLEAATSQVTQALGKPFLGAVTDVVKVAGAPLKGAAGALNSSLGQNVLKVATPALLAFGAARTLGAIGLTTATARNLLANNRLTQAFSAGRAGSTAAFPTRATTAAANMGRGYASVRAPGTGGQSLRQTASQAYRGSINTARFGYQSYNAMLQDSARQLRTPDAFARTSAMGMGANQQFAGLGRLRADMQAANAAGGSLGTRVRAMGAAFATSSKQVTEGAGLVRNAGRVVVGSLENTAVGLRALGATGRAVAIQLNAASGGMLKGAGGLAMSGLKGAGAMLASPMSLLLLGAGAYSATKSANANTKALVDQHEDSSITGTLDAYRESTGRATEAVQTFAEQIISAAKAVSSQVTDFGDALSVRSSDEEVARQTKNKSVHQFDEGASPEQLASQIKAMSPTGMDTQDMQGVKLDLLRQFGSSKAKQVLGMLSGDSTGQAPQGVDFDALLDPSSGQMGLSLKEQARRQVAPHGRGDNVALSKDQKRAVDLSGEAIGQTRAYNSQNFGADYAEQEAGKQANAAFAAARKTGNIDLEAAIAKLFGKDLTGNDVDTDTARNKDYRRLQNGSGSLTDFLSGGDKDFAKDIKSKGIDFSSGGVSRTKVDSEITQATDGIATFGKALSNRAEDVDSSVNKMVNTFLQTPGDTLAMQKAMQALSDDVTGTGGSLADLTAAANKTADAMGDATSEVSKLANAVLQRSIADVAANQGFAGTSRTYRLQTQQAQTLMNTKGTDDESQGKRDQGRAMMQTAQENYRSYLANRLKAQYEYQKQSERAEADYNLQVSRSQQDFYRSEQRSETDFQTQVNQGINDYHRGVARAQRDFNKQMTRMNEDAAKSMYDPYKRIQTQAVYDMGTLLSNLGEQNEAMAKQKQNLDALRASGVNNTVIDQLGLGKTENAQQLQRMIDDIANDPSLAAQINGTIKSRVALGGALNSDSSNKEIQRAKDDFKTSLSDQENDFNLSMKRSRTAFNLSMDRSRADFNRSMARSAKDFQTSLDRQNQDLQDSTKELLGSIEDLQSAAFDLISGKAVDFGKLMHDQLQQVAADASSVSSQLSTGVGGTGASGGGGGNGAAAGAPATVGAALSSHSGQHQVTTGGGAGHMNDSDTKTTSWVLDHKGADEANSIMSTARGYIGQPYRWGGDSPDESFDCSGLMQYAFAVNGISLPRTAHEQQKRGVRVPAGKEKPGDLLFYGNPAHHVALYSGNGKMIEAPHTGALIREVGERKADGGIKRVIPYASGGIAMSPHVGMVAEAGSPEAMIPLNTQGVAKLAEAMTMFLTGPQLQTMMGANYGTKVHYEGNHFVTDHSTHYSGPITVEAADLADFNRQLQEKARRDRLTQAPQTKSSR